MLESSLHSCIGSTLLTGVPLFLEGHATATTITTITTTTTTVTTIKAFVEAYIMAQKYISSD